MVPTAKPQTIVMPIACLLAAPAPLARACPVSTANALGITLTAPPHVSQVVISMSPKAPTFGENPFQSLCLYALGCRSSRSDVLRVCSHLFYGFPGACCPCRVLPVLSVPTGHIGTKLAIWCEHAMEPGQVNSELRHQGQQVRLAS